MQSSSSTTYSKFSPSSVLREMAFCGQMLSHMPQSRQTPQEAQLVAQETRSEKLLIRASKYSVFILLKSIGDS